MNQTALVREVSGPLVTVKPNPPAACFGCLQGECRDKAGLIVAENPAGFELAAGQVVETEFPGVHALRQALMAAVPPILGFAAAYFLAGLFLPASGEPLRAVCGVAGLFLAGFIRYRFRRSSPALPRIVRVIGEH
ncbi:MAG: SoxR reducing system RseC family protein [Treponema sp.]|jgi:positive regulator of sigma E activity|nr:SoxR reducing system RseC family protein [Treponema sp.]